MPNAVLCLICTDSDIRQSRSRSQNGGEKDSQLKPGHSGPAFVALYDNDYRKVDGAWKISRGRLNIVWPERKVEEAFPRTIPVSAIG